MTVAGDLAEFLIRTPYDEIPQRAVDYAAMLILSTVASAAMGSKLESSRMVHNMVVQRGGAGEASIWFGSDPRLPAASVARVNAVMSDSAASDDSDLRNISHLGTPVVAAAVAIAEMTEANGRDILTAIALAYEVAGRINTGVVPGLIWEKGFHGSMVAIFGAAAAASSLLKLDQSQVTQALALAATSIAGLLAAASTSTAREHHAGLAAMLGTEAAQLASLGYTAEESILEHPRGFFFAYGESAHHSGRVAQVTYRMGKDWQLLTDMAIKLAPGAHPFHAIAEAAADAARMSNLPASEIAAIICLRPNARQTNGPRHPTDLIGAAHSPYYFAAAGVADRDFTWVHASQEKIMDPAIRRLLDLVEMVEIPHENAEGYRQGATVTVRTHQGNSFTSTVHAPRGAAVNGIEWADVEGKFRVLCPIAGVTKAKIDECIRVVRHFREVKDIRELLELMR